MRSSRIARRASALLLLLLCVCGADALFFNVRQEGHRCFLVDVPAGTTFRAEYESPDTSETMKTQLAFYAPDPDKAESENKLVKKQVTGDKGSLALTADNSGDHWVCISLDSSDFTLPDNAVMRFALKITMGPSKEEYQDLAKKSHMDDLQLEIVQLRDRVSAIQRNQDYAKEKSLQLQSSIESNNRHATWISVFQIAVLLFTGFFQAKHLQQFFRKKKLV